MMSIPASYICKQDMQDTCDVYIDELLNSTKVDSVKLLLKGDFGVYC